MKKILFVEDEPSLQAAVTSILTEKGYQVVSAQDGKTGLELARQELPDLILLDLILPKMGGFEVLTELKKADATKKIPVIILTNLERSEDVEKAVELGATTYLVKTNYKLEEIVEKVRQVLK